MSDASPTPVGTPSEEGRIAREAGLPEEAYARLHRIVESDPYDTEALHQLGVLHLDRDEPGEAIAWFQRCLEIEAPSPEICHDLGRALLRQGRTGESAAWIQQALVLRPDFTDAQKSLGDVLHAQDDFRGAIAAYSNALSRRPDFSTARRRLGHSLVAAQDYGAAIALFEELLKSAPDDAEAHGYLACALLETGRIDEAVVHYTRALALAPELPLAQVVRGKRLLEIGQAPEAEAAFRQALAADPSHYSGWNNLGAALLAQNLTHEAIAVYEQALARHPDVPQLRYNQGLAHLSAGNFAAGWEGYESRWFLGAGRASRSLPAPLWEGDVPLRGRTVLLHAEQGFGDTFQFVRYAANVIDAGADVILGVPATLCPVIATFPGVQRVIAIGDPLPPFDLHCPLLSLPHALRSQLGSIPCRVPYLAAPADKSAGWRAQLGSGRKVGLVWAGNPGHRQDRFRSIPFADFAALAQAPALRFFSLQKNLRPADATLLASLPHIEDLSPRLHDFADTAAVIANLDLIVTVDTAVAHLAGALGARVWLLVAFAADWRWMTERTDSPWYPTLRIFRQPRPGDWTSVIAAVRSELQAFA